MAKSKNGSVIDRINEVRERQFKERFEAEFGIKFRDISTAFFFELDGDMKLVFRNLSERYKRLDEDGILSSRGSTFVTRDGMKYKF